MSDPNVLAALLPRLLLVLLFLPMSAWDKVANFSGAVSQAREIGVGRGIGTALILAGLAVEIVGSAAVLTGIADGLAALVLAGYCIATAPLWKRFWTVPGSVCRPRAPADRRALFFDFWMNLSVAGGFLVIAFGPNRCGAGRAVEPSVRVRPLGRAVISPGSGYRSLGENVVARPMRPDGTRRSQGALRRGFATGSSGPAGHKKPRERHRGLERVPQRPGCHKTRG